MKKLVAGIFATVVGLSCLTACTPEAKYDVEAATNYLDSTYVNLIVDGREDYEIPNSLFFNNATYTVSWALESEVDGVKLVKKDTTTKVDVNEASAKDVDYVLVATVTDPKGNTASVKFYATLLQANALIPVEITASPVEGTAYKLYVYNDDAKKDCYFAGDYQTTYYLNSVEDYTDSSCVDVYVEYVEGSEVLFNLYFESKLDGKQYVGIKENWNEKKGYWSYNPSISSTPVSQFSYSAEHGTIITTVEAHSQDVQDSAADTTKTIYWSNSGGTYTSIGGNDISKISGSGYVAHLVTMESAAGVAVADKVAFEKDSLSVETSFIGAEEVSLTTYGKRYPDVQIAWSVVEGSNVTIADGKMTVTAPAAETTAKVKATLTLGDVTDSKEFTLTLKPEINQPEANTHLTIVEANALGNQFEKDTYSEGKYYVTGVVKSIASTQYGNIYLKDESGNEFYVYGLYDEDGNRFDAMATKPAVGDTITVYGVIGKYNSAQMKNGTMTALTPGTTDPTPNEKPTTSTIATILASEAGSYAAEGTIIAINANGYLLQDATGIILVYHGFGWECNFVVGDKVLVSGTTSVYGGATQFGNGCTDEKTGTGTVSHGDPKALTPAECDAYKTATTVTPAYVTVTGTLSVTANSKNNGYYYNLTIDGATIKGSLSYPTAAQHTALEALNGKQVKVTGYVTGTASQGAFFNILVTAFEEVVSETPGTDPDPETPVVETIADIVAGELGSHVAEGMVVAINARGFVLQDATGAILVYYNSWTCDVEIGDTLTVTGTTTTYANAVQFGSPTYEKGASAEYTYGEAHELTAEECNNYASASSITPAYVTVTAKLSISGNYYNLAFDGSEVKGSITYPAAADKTALAPFNGKQIKLTGFVTGYNGYLNIMMTAVEEVSMTAAEKVALVKNELTITDSSISGAKDITLPTSSYEDVTVSWTVTAGTEIASIADGKLTITNPANNTTVTVKADLACGDATDSKTFDIEVKAVSASFTTAKVSIADYATANSWANATMYNTLQLDDNITVTATGGQNTGKYYTSGEQWRTYQNEEPSIIVKAGEGKTIISVKISYAVQNGGVLLNGETQVKTDTVVTVNANEITFGVGNTGSTKNGQVRITAIEVIYE